VVPAKIKTSTKGKLMSVTLPLSPMEDVTQFCDECGEETLHVAMLTSLAENPLAKFYQLECEICMLAWEWN
jgi:hypothetical protein